MADKSTQVNIPDIEVDLASWPKHLTGEVEAAAGGQSEGSSTPPQHGRFVISVGDLQTAEASLMSGIKRVVAEYESLAGYVGGTKDWIFRKGDPDKPLAPLYPPSELPTIGATYEAGSPEERAITETDYALDMEAAQTRLLLAVSDAVAMVGHYVDLLAKSGDFYVRGDKESFLPG